MDLITDTFDIITTLYPGLNVVLENEHFDHWVVRLGHRMQITVYSTFDQSYHSSILVYKSGYHYSAGEYRNCKNDEQCIQYLKVVIGAFHGNMRSLKNIPGLFRDNPSKYFIPLERKSHELTT